MRKDVSGFTIVELLIVIVVIAILASVTVASFNGVSTRAKASVAKSDLVTLAKQMEFFKAERGVYPSTLETPRNDLAEVLKKAKLYEATRLPSQEDWSAGKRPPKRFVFCTPDGDESRYAIVVDIPVLQNTFDDVGKITYFIDESGRVQEMTFTEAVSGSIAGSLCVTATSSSAASWNGSYYVWSNGTPYSYAP